MSAIWCFLLIEAARADDSEGEGLGGLIIFLLICAAIYFFFCRDSASSSDNNDPAPVTNTPSRGGGEIYALVRL